jgi:hypothetical protein
MQVAIVKRLFNLAASNSKAAPAYSTPDNTSVIVNGLILHYNAEAGGGGAEIRVAIYVSDVANSSVNSPQDYERIWYVTLKQNSTLALDKLPIVLGPGDGIHIAADVTGVINVFGFGSEVSDS